MKIVFKKIPKIAIYFYVAGFTLIIIGMVSFFSKAIQISAVLTLQIFIAGAIIVACGSVINTVFQFKKSNDNN